MSRGDTPCEGRECMSTPQNGVAAYSQSHVSCICQGGFPLPSLRFSSLSVLLWWVLANCRGFPLTTLSSASSQLLAQTPRVRLARRYRVTRT